MANKKISQLSEAANVGAGDFFPVATSAGGGTYDTKKCETETLATYVLSPIPAAISDIGFTGTSEVYLKKSNWSNASTTIEDNPYLQVRVSDGKLITGSGVAVPASAGDNMGNCTATQDVKMQAFSITGCGNVGFGNNNAIGGLDRSRVFNSDGNGTDLQVLAYRDLQLSGNRNIDVNAQALDLTDTPITGNVSIENGNLNFPAGQGNITVDDVIYRKRAYNFSPENVGSVSTTIDWSDGNVQYASRGGTTNFTFTNDVNGQTLTMYVTNSTSSEITVNFNGGSTTVYWAAEYSNAAPKLAGDRTNLYTFVNINNKIWASAITGYVF